MDRQTLDQWLERGILFLVLGIVVFAPLATGAVRSLEFLVVQGLTIIVMALWLARLWINPKPKLLWPPLTWVILAFALYAVARYFTADVEYVARKEIIRILVYAFLFLVIVNNLHRQESTQIISFTMIALGAGISCYAVYQYLTESDRVWHLIKPQEYIGRGGGTYICPNHFAGFLEMLLPLALAYTLAGRGKALTKVLLGYAALLMLAGMGATVSRAGWAACGLSLVFLFGVLVIQPGRRLPAFLSLCLLVAVGTLFIVKMDPLKKRFKLPHETTVPGLTELDMRYELWAGAIRLWKESPWFGVGPGHYDVRFREFRPQRVQKQPDRAHNEYLNVLADWGIVGGLIVITGLGTLVWSVVRTWKHVRRQENEMGSGLSNKFAFVLGASSGLLALAIHSVLDFNMHIPANAILAITLAALLVSHLRFATERYWSSARLWMKSSLTVVLLSGIAYLGWQEVRLGREYAWLDRAAKMSAFSPRQAEMLKKAFALEPTNHETSYNIGESYRMQSFEGGENYRELAEEAMKWYKIGFGINHYEGYNYMRYGMCLDWIDRQSEAGFFFSKAEELDPNGYYMVGHIGWHYVQLGDYAAAREWFQRSVSLLFDDNDIAHPYLRICERKLLQQAGGKANPLAQ